MCHHASFPYSFQFCFSASVTRFFFLSRGYHNIDWYRHQHFVIAASTTRPVFSSFFGHLAFWAVSKKSTSARRENKTNIYGILIFEKCRASKSNYLPALFLRLLLLPQHTTARENRLSVVLNAQSICYMFLVMLGLCTCTHLVTSTAIWSRDLCFSTHSRNVRGGEDGRIRSKLWANGRRKQWCFFPDFFSFCLFVSSIKEWPQVWMLLGCSSQHHHLVRRQINQSPFLTQSFFCLCLRGCVRVS